MKNLMLLAALAMASSASGVKWEYGILVYSQGYVEWQSPSGYVTTDDLKKTMAKMLCKVSGNKSVNYIEFLNCVGPLGWELVTIQETSESQMFYFKRSR